MNATHAELRSDITDSGLGLMEIVISMFMLALLALAFLPLLIAGVKQSVANATQATATQLVSEQMQLAQSKGPVCANVAALAGQTSLTDPQGVVLQRTTTVGSCAGTPATVSVTTSVIRLDTAVTVATATTLVYVGS